MSLEQLKTKVQNCAIVASMTVCIWRDYYSVYIFRAHIIVEIFPNAFAY